uniref:Uncharacterized protein n=1 Tax=Oryza sativa subsp. japonica TaxID=39947 RepID=Q8S754_ORYSJ|nr:Hypothetical protein [Oryza sativa Japonica Group]
MAGGGRRQLGTAADKDEHGWEQATYGRGRWRLLTRRHSHRRGNDWEWRHPRPLPCAADKEEE